MSHKTSSTTDPGIISNNLEITLPPGTPEKPNPDRVNLLKMLANGTADEPIKLANILPKFLKITNTGVSQPYTEILDNEIEGRLGRFVLIDQQRNYLQILGVISTNETYRNVSLKLFTSNTSRYTEWWNVQEDRTGELFNRTLKDLPYEDSDALVIYTLNDKIFPSTLKIITGGG